MSTSDADIMEKVRRRSHNILEALEGLSGHRGREHIEQYIETQAYCILNALPDTRVEEDNPIDQPHG